MEPSRPFLATSHQASAPWHARAFTLIEMLVVLAIISVVTVITLGGHSEFDRSILITDTAYTMAISVRQMQTFGLSSRISPNGTAVRNAGYGIHASTATPTSYLLFADIFDATGGNRLPNCVTGTANTPEAKPGDCRYTAGSDAISETMTLTRGFRITNMCGRDTGGVKRCSSDGYLQALDAVYTRPNTDAALSGQRTTSGTPWIELTSGELYLSTADGASTRVICLSRIGQISVATSTCP